jgi:hypothetical protein
VRYAILSDIHGNLEALRAVLADCRGRADGVLCLGDTVGYGADPLACVELVAEQAQAIVCGNHEFAVLGRLPLTWFNRHARAAAEWTQERLDEDHRAYLSALPPRWFTLRRPSPTSGTTWWEPRTGLPRSATSPRGGASWATAIPPAPGRWARRAASTIAAP